MGEAVAESRWSAVAHLRPLKPASHAPDSGRRTGHDPFTHRALDIAEAVAERIGSYIDMNFIQFLAVEGNRVQCWYMNDSGKGSSFEIELNQSGAGWCMKLTEHPAGTDQQIEVP